MCAHACVCYFPFLLCCKLLMQLWIAQFKGLLLCYTLCFVIGLRRILYPAHEINCACTDFHLYSHLTYIKVGIAHLEARIHYQPNR